jgi:hypothetical protein
LHRHREIGEHRHEDEHVVDGERVLDDIARQELKRGVAGELDVAIPARSARSGSACSRYWYSPQLKASARPMNTIERMMAERRLGTDPGLLNTPRSKASTTSSAVMKPM